MTNEPINFEAAAGARYYKKLREQLRPYYGAQVYKFDYGQLDEFAGEMDVFIDEHGREPRDPLEFLDWHQKFLNLEIKLIKKILQRSLQ